jgi:uncharacterized membrane protein YqjE
MIETIVKIAGSIFCLGAGVVLLTFGLMVLSVLVIEILNHFKDKK